MPSAILGRKIGMTRYFDESGKNIPVTVIQAGPCFVSQVKTVDTDGYNAVQIAFEDVKARNSTFQLIGHDAKAGLAPKRFHREIRFADDQAPEVALGDSVDVNAFAEIKYVDVIAKSKGKGFAGAMKRHGFKGQLASHGVERKHRSPGSIGGNGADLGGGRNKKGIKMPGHMGAVQVTTRSLDVVKVDAENNLLLVKGPVPGAKGDLVFVREAIRLFKRKVDK